jgi:catechol 2,3-dioxygenase-like lactoylglutathione lyase family enzyme
MIDHLSTYATDYEATKRFYRQALEPLGYGIQMEFPDRRVCAFGPAGKPAFWVIGVSTAASPRHVAFAAPDRGAVAAFHRAALAAGGSDHGAPGLRPDYHPSYFGAFVLDPDGNNVEAVCHAPA